MLPWYRATCLEQPPSTLAWRGHIAYNSFRRELIAIAGHSILVLMLLLERSVTSRLIALYKTSILNWTVLNCWAESGRFAICRRFPMFVAIHRICVGELPASSFLDSVIDHPEHNWQSPPYIYYVLACRRKTTQITGLSSSEISSFSCHEKFELKAWNFKVKFNVLNVPWLKWSSSKIGSSRNSFTFRPFFL